MEQQKQFILTGITQEDFLSNVQEKVRETFREEFRQFLKPEKVNEYCDIEEAAQLLRCSKSKLYSLTSTKKIQFIKQGGQVLFKRSDLISWIEAGMQPVVEA